MYRETIRQMADAEPAEPRERSPRRGDRRPLAVQRAEQEAMGPRGNARQIAMLKRDKTIPRPKLKPAAVIEATASSSSSKPPPPPPGAGAVKKGGVQHFDIAKTPRTATRPLAPVPTISGHKRPAPPADAGSILRKKRPAIDEPTRKKRRVGQVEPTVEPPSKKSKMDEPKVEPSSKRSKMGKNSKGWRQARPNTKWSKTEVR